MNSNHGTSKRKKDDSICDNRDNGLLFHVDEKYAALQLFFSNLLVDNLFEIK